MNAAIQTPKSAASLRRAGVLNMWYDADSDALMARTAAKRPIPHGKISRAR
jgi:protoheme IX farnesyltransferase